MVSSGEKKNTRAFVQRKAGGGPLRSPPKLIPEAGTLFLLSIDISMRLTFEKKMGPCFHLEEIYVDDGQRGFLVLVKNQVIISLSSSNCFLFRNCFL